MGMGPGVDSSSILVMIPPNIQAMLDEARTYHPKLAEKLNDPKSIGSFEDAISIIATECDVLLDGIYTGPDLEHLAGILWQKLKAKRGSIII
jgi:hypothetical protein